MLKFLQNLFLTKQFIPHGHCYLWQPKLVWLHVVSDALIALAYYSIPVMLVYFVYKRRDLPFDWIFLMFGTFIVACGTTHVMEIWTLWHPTYWLSGFVKVITAVVSWYTALLLLELIPQALALPSPAQLKAANIALQNEILERKQAELALEKLRHQTELILNCAGEGIYGLDLQGNTTFVNPAAARMVGWEIEEMLGKPQHQILHHTKPDGTPYPQPECPIYAAFQDGLVHQLDNEVFWRKDGVSFPVEYISTPIQEHDELVGAVVVFRDITERVQAQALLNQLNASLEHQVIERTAQLQKAIEFEAMLKRITDKVRDSLDENQIVEVTVQELAVGLSLGGCNAARYNLSDRTSTICYEYVTSIPVYRHRTMQMTEYPEIYNQLLDGQYFQFCSLKPNPSRGQVAILACPIVDDQGVLGDLWLINSVGYIFSELEIRLVQQVANQCAIAIRQARLYQAAKAQVEELQKLNRLKDEFLSTVSHELRTPLSNMKMAISLLKICPTIERQQRYLEILQIECQRETDLINDLLDLQQLETDLTSANKLVESIDLKEVLLNVIQPFLLRTQQLRQTLHLSLPDDILLIVSRRASIERILAELLNNACKYTPPEGEIFFSCCYNSTETATQLSIRNSAEIPAEQLPQIFDKFYRVPDADPWKQGGTGLGLALVRKLVEQLQGIIAVESSRGWTTFTVELPNQPKAYSS